MVRTEISGTDHANDRCWREANTRQTQHQHEQVDEVQMQRLSAHHGLAAGGRGIVAPVINLQIKFPVVGLKIPVPRNNFPVSLSRELPYRPAISSRSSSRSRCRRFC
jgi:hypothetical protein